MGKRGLLHPAVSSVKGFIFEQMTNGYSHNNFSERHSWERISKPQSKDHVASHVYSESFMCGLWPEVQILRWTLDWLVLRMTSLSLTCEEEGHVPERPSFVKVVIPVLVSKLKKYNNNYYLSCLWWNIFYL